MLIRVNGQEFPWEAGMVVKTLLQRKKFTHPAIIVAINGVWVEEDEYHSTIIHDDDDVQVIHLIAGG